MKKIQHIVRVYKNLPVQVKASLWFVASTVLLKGISFITVPIFTRIMTTEQYGIFSIYLTWYEMLVAIGTLSLESCAYMNALTKFDEERKNEAQTSLLQLGFFVTSILLVVVLLFGQTVSTLTGLPQAMLVLMVVQIYAVPAVNFWSVRSRFQYKYKGLVFVSVSMSALNALLGIVFVLNMDAAYQAYGRVFSIVLVHVLYAIVLLGILNKSNSLRLTTKYWKWGLTLHIPLLPHTLSLKILGSADRIMINSMIGASAAALYSVAYSIAIVVNLIKTSIIDALRPWLYQKLESKETGNTQKVFTGVLFFVTLMTIAFMAFAPEIIYIAAPQNYREAVYCMPPVMVSSFFTFLYSVFSIVEMYYEETKKIMVASIGAAILNIVLNYALIPMFGYIAAAFTTLVCYIALAVFHYCMAALALKKYDVKMQLFDSKGVLGLCGIVLFFMVAFEFLYNTVLLRYAFVLVILLFVVGKKDYFINLYKTIRSKN